MPERRRSRCARPSPQLDDLLPVLDHGPATVPTGFASQLLDLLADAWGVLRSQRGTETWFEISARRHDLGRVGHGRPTASRRRQRGEGRQRGASLL